MTRDLKKQQAYEAGLIILLALAIGFCVLVIGSVHNLRYGKAQVAGDVFFYGLPYVMARFGFADEAVNAVRMAGFNEFLPAFAAAILFSLAGICYCNNAVPGFIKRRYGLLTLGVAIAAAAIALQLNGTSLHCWAEAFQTDKASAPLWGITRPIRSDEYAVWSPMTISQELSGFHGVSNLIGGGGTNATWVSMGGIPAINKALAFKPLYWGIILFGSSYGISILWVGRTLVLFFASYYCAMIYTDRKRHFSFAAATMITLSPYVQWWFSQSIAEVIFYPELIFLCYWGYLHCDDSRKRIALSVAAAWLFGCFIMIGYPTWIIPMLCMLIACLIAVFIRNRKNLVRMDSVIVAIPMIMAFVWIALIVKDTWPELMAVSASVYPGENSYTGGFINSVMQRGLHSLMLPYADAWQLNNCELASCISFIPAGLILTVYTAVKNKKIDKADIALIAAEAVILYIFTIHIPAPIAEITLISRCYRLEYIFGFIDIILMIRALSKQDSMPAVKGMAVVVLAAAASILLYIKTMPELKIETICLITTAYVLSIATILIRPFQVDRERYSRFICCCIVMLMIIAGAFVNPVQKGVHEAYKTELLEVLQNVDDEEGDLYFCEGGVNFGNYMLMAGKRVFNSTQEYANTEKWKTLDPDCKYLQMYNRFFNASGGLTEGETEFRLEGPDYVYIGLSFNDLQKAGIKYVVSPNDYTSHNGILFDKVGEGEGWKIYRIREEQ